MAPVGKTPFLLFALLFANGLSVPMDKVALEENYGYVDVRPGAHMFWVVYHTELPGDWSNHPLILWLQGGPGASGVGYGNFEELGPYNIDGTLRPGRWTQKANLMFVDNPVGSGYSYVDNLNALTTDNSQIAQDLVSVVKSVFTQYPAMQGMPFFVYAESYGGKMTVDFALALDAAIKNGEIVCNFQGVALGDSWISPMDSVNTWAPFLYEMGFVNQKEKAAIDDAAALAQSAVDNNQWEAATDYWGYAENVILFETGGVDFYNVLATEDIYYAKDSKRPEFSRANSRNQLYNNHVKRLQRDALDNFMNSPSQKARWGIPSSVTWGGQSNAVFDALYGDFMKPVISSVERLLNETNIHVAVFTGDLDLICDTPGTYLWIEKMQWKNKALFENAARQNINIAAYSNIAAYVQRYQTFSLFTILRSGHMVPIDAPDAALTMIDLITSYGVIRK